MGCSGVNPNNTAFCVSPPPSPLPFSLFNSLHPPSIYLLFTFFSLNKVSVLSVYLLVFPFPRHTSFPPHTHISRIWFQGSKRQSPSSFQNIPQVKSWSMESRHDIMVETTCRCCLVYPLNRCRDRFPAIPNYAQEPRQCGHWAINDRHDLPSRIFVPMT